MTIKYNTRMTPWRLLITPPGRGVWNMAVDEAILEKYPPFPSILKALLHYQRGKPCRSVKPPLESISLEMEENAVQEFQEIS